MGHSFVFLINGVGEQGGQGGQDACAHTQWLASLRHSRTGRGAARQSDSTTGGSGGADGNSIVERMACPSLARGDVRWMARACRGQGSFAAGGVKRKVGELKFGAQTR